VKSQYIGTWYITSMEAWDADYINAAGRGHLRIDQDGCGFMQFGALEAALDCRTEDIGSNQRLEFTFQGVDEGNPVSGRGWCTVSGSEMTGRIYFHWGEASGFAAVKDQRSETPARSSPKVIRLPKRLGAAKARPLPETGAPQKIRQGQAVEIHFSDAEKELLEEYTLIDPEYMDRLQSTSSGRAWTGRYTLGELEDIVGYIGEGEGHAEDKKIVRRLGSLISRLNKELDSYDDGG
jgi:hypothetical protein